MSAYGCIRWFVHAIHSWTIEFPRISLSKQKRKHGVRMQFFLKLWSNKHFPPNAVVSVFLWWGVISSKHRHGYNLWNQGCAYFSSYSLQRAQLIGFIIDSYRWEERLDEDRCYARLLLLTMEIWRWQYREHHGPYGPWYTQQQVCNFNWGRGLPLNHNMLSKVLKV